MCSALSDMGKHNACEIHLMAQLTIENHYDDLSVNFVG